MSEHARAHPNEEKHEPLLTEKQIEAAIAAVAISLIILILVV